MGVSWRLLPTQSPLEPVDVRPRPQPTQPLPAPVQTALRLLFAALLRQLDVPLPWDFDEDDDDHDFLPDLLAVFAAAHSQWMPFLELHRQHQQVPPGCLSDHLPQRCIRAATQEHNTRTQQHKNAKQEYNNTRT